jgi:hypothetical protein
MIGIEYNAPNSWGYAWGRYQAYDTSTNIAYGILPTVSGTIVTHPEIHRSEFLTDGYYGNGRSWVAPATNSWILLDLGRRYFLDSLAFGEDRTGQWDDRDPGQYFIEASIDGISFTTIADSQLLGFSGFISGNDTIVTTLDRTEARYVRLTVANLGARIDEIEIRGDPVSEPASPVVGTLGIIFLISSARFVGRAEVRKPASR